ncbi:protein of unknown function [Pseudotevenvirus RB43]|uniref:Uncharacterized protein n=2 Tax=Pseudotevenvirus RB43 TaxID=115991 RepID=Q56BC6_9CAUD|nr:hypothetical protein RB43ORF273w [Escherichia phage RB43]AAX78795.1 hypothetical protein RB43ORF273w [Escherichia phage RB43]CCK74114.1 protein of unknown function [Pseudotevenvirus RB43]CCL97731.1 protein of unknown function [Pseudotevenvirus RB43]
MILNFKTRKEAREYCWKWGIPLKSITKTANSSNLPWRVTTEETMFKTGRDYELVDVEGFTNNGKNKANVTQAKQIKQHLNGVITIISKDGDKFEFKSPECVVMDIVRPWEAVFFKEVKPTVNAKPRSAKPAPVQADTVDAVVDDLDAALDGGVNLAPVEAVAQEAWPTLFVCNIPYVLIDEAGFIAAHGANKTIVDFMKENNGVLTFECVDSDGDATIKTFKRNIPMVMHSERKYFRELGTGKVPAPAVQVVDVTEEVNKNLHERKIIEAAQKVEDALAEHQKAIVVVQQAARAVREAAQELALLSRK